MRVAYIAAGAAGMYCGSCIHDNTLAAALIRHGVEVALLPTYTPLRTDEEDVSGRRVFYGGINVFLQQKLGLFRHTPRRLDRLLDGRWLLGTLSRFSASTSAADLGALTVSVLQGEEGRQKKELAKLVDWLAAEFEPDLVQLTNSMFVGMARRLKETLAVPVVCALQGEDLFLDRLIEPYRARALATLRARAADVDGFIAPNTRYADAMAGYLAVPREWIDVVPLGLNLDGYSEVATSGSEEFTLGYLARICPEKGLHLLVEAYALLRQRGCRLRLEVAGFLGRRDRDYCTEQRRRLRRWEEAGEVVFHGEVDRAGKLAFLQGLDALCVPTVYREAKGRFALEAMAAAVPVIAPEHGAFPELLVQTGGGILVAPNSVDAIVSAVERLLDEPELRRTLARSGRDRVHASFGAEEMARSTAALYQRYLNRADWKTG